MTSPQDSGTDHAADSPTQAADSSAHTEGGPNGSQPAGHGFFLWLRQLGVRRGTQRWIGGVCSGVAERLGWDPLLVRIIWFALCFFGGAGIALYGVAWLLLPDARDGSLLVEEVTKGHITPGFVISIIMIVGGAAGSTATLPFVGVGLILTIGLAVAAIAILSSQNKRSAWNANNPAPAPAEPNAAQTASFTPPQAPPSSSNIPNYSAAPQQADSFTQPWVSTPQAPPQKPTPAYPVRKPAYQGFVSVVYGLLFLAAAAIVALAFLTPYASGLGGWELFLIWVLVADVIVGLALLTLGISGRRSSSVGWMVAPLLILTIMAYSLPQVGSTRVSHVSSGNSTVMTSRDYTSADFDTLQAGLDVTMSNVSIDLQDWETAGTGSECPTGTINLDVRFSEVDIELPPGCSWHNAGINSTGAQINDYLNYQETTHTSQGLSLAGNAIFSSININED